MEARGFLSQSNLPGQTLHRIWGLADLDIYVFLCGLTLIIRIKFKADLDLNLDNFLFER